MNGTLLVANSIIGGSTSGRDVSGSIKDAGYNIYSDTSFHPPKHSTSVNGTLPLVGPLANNGGPTQTLELLAGSPARDKIPPGLAPTSDQRGLPRPINLLSDIGATEYDSAGPPLITQQPRPIDESDAETP